MIKELTYFYLSFKKFIWALSLGAHTIQTVAKYVWLWHC